ncbi:MAG: hypothetical protein EBY20_11050, partial [Alphaproteobacteria bacterium]|nr:hypothetical protein [Alphaproteobacteria bacterium]
NLNITSWHPIMMHGKWIFPNTITNSGKLIMDKVAGFAKDKLI